MTGNLDLFARGVVDDRTILIRKQTHEQYTVPPLDFPLWAIERHRWKGSEKVLDVGSGPALYLQALSRYIPEHQYTGYDVSQSMLKAAKVSYDGVACVCGSGEALPFADQSFDVVLANHMLYLVNDIDHTLQEIHRVLKPQGVLIAATNSQFTMPEFNTLIQRAFRLLGRPLEMDEGFEQRVIRQFSLETGIIHLARHFRAVARYDVPGELIFPDPKPIIEYISSSRLYYERYMPEGIIWEDFMTIMGDQVRRLVEHFGELVVKKLSGVLIASDEGGFANDYFTLMGR